MSTETQKTKPNICLATFHGVVARRFRYVPLVHQVEDLFYDALWNKKPRYLYVFLEEDGRLMALSLSGAFSHRVMQGHAKRAYSQHRKNGLVPVHIMSLDTKLPFDDQIRASVRFSPEIAENFDAFRDEPLETIYFKGENLLTHAQPAGFLTGPEKVNARPATLKMIAGTWVRNIIDNGMIKRTPFAGSPVLAYPTGS